MSITRIVQVRKKNGCDILAEMPNLKRDGLLFDMTLSAEGRQLHIHRIVLAAFSPYFRKLLQNISSPHPKIVLDIPYADLKILVHFLYQGTVQVPNEQLDSVLRTANTLMIREIRMEPGTPPIAVAQSDQQPGPSGLGGPSKRPLSPSSPVPSGSSVNEARSLVSMMLHASLIEGVYRGMEIATDPIEGGENALDAAREESDDSDDDDDDEEDDGQSDEQMEVDVPDDN